MSCIQCSKSTARIGLNPCWAHLLCRKNFFALNVCSVVLSVSVSWQLKMECIKSPKGREWTVDRVNTVDFSAVVPLLVLTWKFQGLLCTVLFDLLICNDRKIIACFIREPQQRLYLNLSHCPLLLDLDMPKYVTGSFWWEKSLLLVLN